MTPALSPVALLIEHGFDDGDVTGVVTALRAAQLDVILVAPFAARAYTGQLGHVITSDAAGAKVRAGDVSAVIVPGGQAPDRLRMRHALLDLVRDAVKAGTPVGAIGHGPQVLISADVLRGRTLTCWPSIAIDVKNAGGLYVDRPVVEDGPVITARKGDDLPAFMTVLLRALGR